MEWGIKNVGRVKAYIYIHVFNEAFQLEAFLKDVMRLVFPWLVEIRSRFCLPEERHVVLQLVAFLMISTAPVKLDFSSHEALVIGYPAHLTRYS